ncbi:uncharacterized protein LOC144115965 isoform X2 [Amblyomma americanum]
MMEASPDSLPRVPGTSSAESLADETSMPPSEPTAKKAKASRAPRRSLVPRLRSSRGRNLKLPVRFKSEGLKDDYTNWTVNERKQLLDALKEHGSSDLEKLAQAVPTRSATAINYFLMERRRKKDRIVVEGATGRRTTQALRILRRALDVNRRRFDRSQALVQVVASCQRQPFLEPTEGDGAQVPKFEDIYQMLRDVMENKVPAALGPCEQFVVRRLLGTLATLVDTLDLNEEREVLKKQLAEAATRHAMPTMDAGDGCGDADAERPRLELGEKPTMNFPSMSQRMKNLKSAWNPLQLPPEIIQKPWPVINELMAANIFRSDRTTSQGKSAPPTAAQGGSRREPQSLNTFSAWKH